MAESFSQRELRNESGEVMRRLDQGESFILRFVSAAEAMEVFRNGLAIDADRFRGDLDVWTEQDTQPRT